MPSTYDPLLRLELQATGENATTWGIKTNNNLDLIAAAVAGVAPITIVAADTTLTTANGASDQARAAILLIQGTLTGDSNIILPASPKTYAVIRNTTGSYNVTFKQAAGTGSQLPASGTEIIVCTSTTCYGLVAGFTSALAAVETRVANVSASVSALNVQVAAVSAAVSVVGAQVNAVSAAVSSLAVQINDVSAAVSALDVRVAAVSAAVSAVGAQVNAVSAAVSSLNALNIRIIE